MSCARDIIDLRKSTGIISLVAHNIMAFKFVRNKTTGNPLLDVINFTRLFTAKNSRCARSSNPFHKTAFSDVMVSSWP